MGKSPKSRIRRAGGGDLEAILDIEARAFEPARRSSRAALRRALSSGFQQVLVLEDRSPESGGIGGYVIVWPFRRTWRIYNLAADPERHNQGVGGALLAAAAAAARQAGADRLVLEARLEPALLRFYERRGFLRTGQLADYYAPGQDAVRLELDLRHAGATG